MCLQVGANVKVGFALHWNKVCGNCFFMPYTRTAQQYNATYAKAFGDQRDYIKGNYNLGTLKRVFEISDVLGISHYAPMPTDSLNFGSFEVSINFRSVSNLGQCCPPRLEYTCPIDSMRSAEDYFSSKPQNSTMQVQLSGPCIMH
jgi:hypothetical protein